MVKYEGKIGKLRIICYSIYSIQSFHRFSISDCRKNKALLPMNLVYKRTPKVCGCAIWTYPVALTKLQPCPGSWSVPAPRFSNAQALKHLELQKAAQCEFTGIPVITISWTIQVTAGLPAKKLSGQWSDLRCSGCVQPLEGLWLHHLGSGTLSRSLPIFLHLARQPVWNIIIIIIIIIILIILVILIFSYIIVASLGIPSSDRSQCVQLSGWRRTNPKTSHVWWTPQARLYISAGMGCADPSLLLGVSWPSLVFN